MNSRSIAGLVVLGVGAFLLFIGGSFTSRSEMVRVGDFKVTATEHRAIPPWIGGVVMAAGALLLITGVAKRK